MTRFQQFSLAAVLIAVAGTSGGASNDAAQPFTGVRPAQIPLSFESNQGQSDERVKFLARGRRIDRKSVV